MPARLTVLSGPSGAGKGSVVAVLRTILPQIWVSVSCTTRAPRPGEIDGEHYFFVDHPEFERMRTAEELLECDEHFGNWYGTPRRPVLDHLDAGVSTLLEIDLEGARQVRDRMADARFVFLAPPSLDELVNRLNVRGADSTEQLRARLDRARVELDAAAEFDDVVVNDDLEDAARQVAALVTAP